jgi:glycolate oxidase iron-sulfur subunit
MTERRGIVLPPLIPAAEVSREKQLLLETLSQCVRCGSCLPTCPTYREQLHEGHSPRGRISLVRAMVEEGDNPSFNLNAFLYGCLECRACETACPNNVVFHQIIEHGKESLNESLPQNGSSRFFKWLFLKHIFRNSKKLDRFMAFVRFYQKSGLRWLTGKLHLLKVFPWNLYELEKLMPPKAGKHKPARKKNSYTLTPAGEPKGKVMFFSGCIADHWLQEANQATLRLLLRAGYQVVVPSGQQCCGALHVHLGEKKPGHGLARENLKAFGENEHDRQLPIIVNAAGCGASLKEYKELFQGEDDLPEAQAFSARIMDLSQFLVENNCFQGEFRRLEKRITYDDPCHLIHGQGISSQPRKLMQSIPGVEYTELEEASWCCGSAGVYNITNYEMSMELLQNKLEKVAKTGADLLITANPGCFLQLASGVREKGMKMKVKHIAQLLDSCFDSAPELAAESDPAPWD